MRLEGKKEHLEIIAMFEEKRATARIELSQCDEFKDRDSKRKLCNEAIINCMEECIRDSIKLFDIKVVN